MQTGELEVTLVVRNAFTISDGLARAIHQIDLGMSDRRRKIGQGGESISRRVIGN